MQFNDSKPLTFGMELEFQIVSDQTGHLSPSSIQLYDSVKNTADADRYALEATLSTIEINTSVHESADEMLGETEKLTRALCGLAKDNELLIRGGGTQLTQFWNERITTPTPRANELDKRFGFLPKRFSTYGMHVHIGAPSGDAALVMGNVLQALVPLFISMSAASPFLQMADTGYCACRPLEPLIYPNGGPMPYLRNWKELEKAAQEIFDTGLGNTLKDIYWASGLNGGRSGMTLTGLNL